MLLFVIYTEQDKCGDKKQVFLRATILLIFVAWNSKYFNLKLCRSVDNINVHLHTKKQFLKRLNIIYIFLQNTGLSRQYILANFYALMTA
jgi:hypothetical protein